MLNVHQEQARRCHAVHDFQTTVVASVETYLHIVLHRQVIAKKINEHMIHGMTVSIWNMISFLLSTILFDMVYISSHV
jgi:hypothetical protein